MDNFDLRKFVSEKTLLNESAPGYDTRKTGESLPTLESVKAAYEAKKDNEEEPRDGVKSAAAKLGMKSNHIKEEDITETRDLSVKEKMDNILYVMDPVQVIDELLLAMFADDAHSYLDAIIKDHGIMDIDEAKNDIKEDVSKAKELADKVLTVASEGIKDLNGSELMEFRALIAQSFDMKDEAKKDEAKKEEDEM